MWRIRLCRILRPWIKDGWPTCVHHDGIWVVHLRTDGEMAVYKHPGEVPGCGYGEPVGNVFAYGSTWKKAGFKCTSSKFGLKCTANGSGFKQSRAGLVQY